MVEQPSGGHHGAGSMIVEGDVPDGKISAQRLDDIFDPAFFAPVPAPLSTAQEDQRLAAEKVKADEAKRIEDETRAVEIAGFIREENRREEAARIALAERQRQDADFIGRELFVGATITGLRPDGGEIDIDIEYPADAWQVCDDEAQNEKLVALLREEVAAAVRPYLDHFPSTGFIRADSFDSDEPRFFLVTRLDAEGFLPDRLCEFPEREIALACLPGAKLIISARHCPIGATVLWNEFRQRDKWEGFGHGEMGVACWEGTATPALFPTEGEGRDDWLDRVARGGSKVARVVERWTAAGRDPEYYRQFQDFSEVPDADCAESWPVPRIIPRGAITLLVGDSGIGKTSLLQEWLSALSGFGVERPTTILGVPVPGRHICAFLSTEDSRTVVQQRADLHKKIWGGLGYWLTDEPDMKLAEQLLKLRKLPNLDILVIDPAIEYFDGDEDKSGVARDFFKVLKEFAREKNCAVIVSHHIKKVSSPPRTIEEVHRLMRGSSDFKAAARMVICMLKRRDGAVLIGPTKFNFPDSDVWLPKYQAAEFWVDAETSTLVPFEEHTRRGTQNPVSGSTDAQSAILSVVLRCNSSGEIVRRTGKSGLFEGRFPEISGLSRSAILDDIGQLISVGKLVDGKTGLHAI